MLLFGPSTFRKPRYYPYYYTTITDFALAVLKFNFTRGKMGKGSLVHVAVRKRRGESDETLRTSFEFRFTSAKVPTPFLSGLRTSSDRYVHRVFCSESPQFSLLHDYLALMGKVWRLDTP